MIAPLVVGGVVVLHGDILPALLDALLIAARNRKLNGNPVSSTYGDIAQAIITAMSAVGRSDVRTSAPPQSYVDDPPTVTVAEAARRLGLSERQTRRLAPRLGGRIIAGRWLLDAIAIDEHEKGQMAWTEKT